MKVRKFYCLFTGSFIYGFVYAPNLLPEVLMGSAIGVGIGLSIGIIFYYLLAHCPTSKLLPIGIITIMLVGAWLFFAKAG